VAYGNYGNGTEFVSLDLDNLEGRPSGMCYEYVPSEDDRGAISSDAY
jgi:hypothetical protein